MEDVDSLDGRALDAAVARHLFGLEVEERIGTRTGLKGIVCRQPGKDWNLLPLYAVSAVATFNVKDELAKRGWTWHEGRPRPQQSQRGAGRVFLDHTDGRVVEAEGASVEEALCRAAVKAVAP